MDLADNLSRTVLERESGAGVVSPQPVVELELDGLQLIAPGEESEKCGQQRHQETAAPVIS